MTGMPVLRDAPSATDAASREGSPARLAARWSALPIRWRWLIGIAGAVVLFVLYSDLIYPIAERWNAEGDRIEKILDEAEGNRAQLPRSLEDTVEALGPIRVPRSEAEGSLALAETITAAIGNHPVTKFSLDARAGSKLPPAALREIVSASGQRVERVVGEVGFTATPEQAAAIISELEASPDVESISRLRVIKSKDADRKVEVKMTVEAWILTGRGGRSR